MIKKLFKPLQIRSWKVFLLLFVGLVLTLKLSAQQPQVLTNASSFTITNYELLPDKGYNIQRVIKDTSLAFKSDSLRISASVTYWIKLELVNPYPTDERYVLSLSKPLSYTIYSFDYNSQKWTGQPAGLGVADRERKAGLVPLKLRKQTSQTIYLKIQLGDIKKLVAPIKPAIVLEKEYTFLATEQFIYLSYLFCCIALLSFSGYNLYLYFELKDSTFLFYVVAQLGAIVYITGSSFFVNVLLPIRIYSIKLKPNGEIATYTLNAFFEHVGTAIIFWGFICFTRLYLRTKELLPIFDKALKTLAYVYVAIEVIFPVITISTGHIVNTVYVANLLILVMLATIIATGIAANERGVRVAKIFLMANLLPMVFIAATSITILGHAAIPFLPAIAILSQILTFAMALVSRLKITNDELKAKEIKAIKLESEITIREYKNTLIEQENINKALTIELEKERNEVLQRQLEANQRELVGNSLYIHQKNKLLAELKTHMGDIKYDPTIEPEVLKNIRSSLNEGEYLDEEWDKFKLHFEQVHPRFFKELQTQYPTLTRYELRLYAYFHINMSTKEIATLLNIAPASVRQAKMRLHKKMGINTTKENIL
jgi:DNA-binding CsgD family transcriptional regulator